MRYHLLNKILFSLQNVSSFIFIHSIKWHRFMWNNIVDYFFLSFCFVLFHSIRLITYKIDRYLVYAQKLNTNSIIYLMPNKCYIIVLAGWTKRKKKFRKIKKKKWEKGKNKIYHTQYVNSLRNRTTDVFK